MREVWPDDISSTSLFKKNKIEFKVMTREMVLQDPIYDTNDILEDYTYNNYYIGK